MGYGACAGGYGLWIGKTLIFVVASFVFAIIFLSTKKWFEQLPLKKKK
jgi:hypothetical protein